MNERERVRELERVRKKERKRERERGVIDLQFFKATLFKLRGTKKIG